MESEAEIEIKFKVQLLTERRHFCALGLMPHGGLPGEKQAAAILRERAMKIESLMHRNVRATRPWDSALDALRSMWEGDCGVLPVVDAGGRVTGIVTDRDLAMAAMLRGQELSELHVDEVASRPVVACLEDGSLSVVHALMRRLVAQHGAAALSGHFHDTRAMAVANCYAALDAGIRKFDSSIAGLGGCPFAPGATGNVCTEDMVNLMHELGIETGIDLEALCAVARKVEAMLGRQLPGQVMKAGPRSRLSGIDCAVRAIG